jgi:hypothetical protein
MTPFSRRQLCLAGCGEYRQATLLFCPGTGLAKTHAGFGRRGVLDRRRARQTGVSPREAQSGGQTASAGRCQPGRLFRVTQLCSRAFCIASSARCLSAAACRNERKVSAPAKTISRRSTLARPMAMARQKFFVLKTPQCFIGFWVHTCLHSRGGEGACALGSGRGGADSGGAVLGDNCCNRSSEG